jgi:hypothetical protein
VGVGLAVGLTPAMSMSMSMSVSGEPGTIGGGGGVAEDKVSQKRSVVAARAQLACRCRCLVTRSRLRDSAHNTLQSSRSQLPSFPSLPIQSNHASKS